MFWVTILGTEEEAQKFEVRITAGPNHKNDDMGIKITGRVYSIEMSKDEVLQDQNGILEVSKNMTGKMGEIQNGVFEIYTEFDIRKLTIDTEEDEVEEEERDNDVSAIFTHQSISNLKKGK